MRLFKHKKSDTDSDSNKKCGARYYINHTHVKYSTVWYTGGTWEPFVAGPELAIDTVNGRSCLHVQYSTVHN